MPPHAQLRQDEHQQKYYTALFASDELDDELLLLREPIGEVCAICLEVQSGLGEVVSICGHGFHKVCINKNIGGKCPHCRQPWIPHRRPGEPEPNVRSIEGREYTIVDWRGYNKIDLNFASERSMGRFIQLRSTPVSFSNEVREETALITELDNNRIATLPVEVGQLAGLVSINLSRNGLTPLPVEIGQLSSLKVLCCFDNRLTSIPVDIGKLSNLTLIDLSHNHLTSIPVEIGQLSKLKTLRLRHNKLTSLPDEITNLVGLKYLKIDFNQLTSLPSDIGQLSKLKELILNYNKLATPSLIISLSSSDSL